MPRMTRAKGKAAPLPFAADTTSSIVESVGRRSGSSHTTTLLKSAFVANSTDIEDDSSSALGTNVDTPKRTRSSSRRRLLESVVIHTAKTETISHASRRICSNTTESRSPEDSAASTRDDSVAYETPNTTTANTPAAGFASFSGNPGPKFLLGGSAMNMSTKRKRNARTTHDVRNDEALARQMQEEEYGGEEAIVLSRSTRSSRGRATVIDSEEDEFLEISDSEDDAPLRKRSQPAQFGDLPQPTSSRRAAKNIATPAALQLGSEESEFDPYDDEPLLNRRGSISTLTSIASTASESNLPAARKAIKASRPARRQRAVNRMRRGGEPYDRKAARRAKLEKAHPEIKTMWEDLETVPIITPVEAQQPESITRRLKGFQLQGLDWMIKQERSSYKGGLLGDEMGMGKTIQAVSLIMSDFPVKEPSLVLVPPVALMQWKNEIGDYTHGKLKVLVVHNTNAESKNLTPKKIRTYNVIMMSYNSLESMFRKQEKGWSRGEDIVKEASAIHAIKWHRIILDEAHSIKSRTTGVAKACFALKASYKWCLSGTPVQNRIGEFFSLLRFLEVRPFSDYFCERCDCAQLHWSVGEDYMCTHCKHSAAEHRSVFNEELLNPITGDSMVLREEALDKLHMITARVMLRRMKKDYTSSMELPPKEVVIHNEFFGEIERDFSSSIMSNTARKFNTYVAQGVMLNNYANIFGLIMQMRQVANHPDLITRKHAEGGQNVLICSICDDPAEEPIKSRCQGRKCSFCRECVKNYIQTCEASGTDPDCPRCHVALSVDWDQPEIVQDEDAVKKSSIINRINMENWTSSTKIEMLVYDLYKLRSKKQTLKSIVFSQFTSMLQLVEWRLRRAGFNTVMLDGSMTPVQRQRSIDHFMNNADVEVFLVSLKAGGVALNLVEASRVFIIDPWWNPAAEWQSADRCHRIGQTRPCVITRLVIEDSVESRMVMLQEKKASMISGTINNDKVAMEKLSPEDLQFLFRGT